MTVASGWASIVLLVLGLHRWVAIGTMDWWARAGLILGAGLAIMWAWGYWPQIAARTRHWVRSGGLNTTVIAIGLVLCLIVVNLMVRRRMPVKWDLTQNKRFTLSDRSRQVLKSLDQPVQATVFLPAGAGRSAARAKDLFKQYADAGDRFNWKRVDPLLEQEKYLAINPPPRLSSTDFTGAILEYDGKRQDVTDFTEKEVTSAILKMTRSTPRKVLFVKGHGELEVEGQSGDPRKSIQVLLQDLRESNWPIETADLYGKTAKTPDPKEVAALVIAGPERELAPEEWKRVEEYLNKGGHVLLMLNPQGPTFSKQLASWGIKTGDDLVIDRVRGALVVEADASAHQAVRSARRTLFLNMRSVTAASPAPGGITVTELLKSGATSEVVPNFVPGKTDLRQALANAKPGPTGIAAMAEKKIGTGDDAPTARLIVVGDNTFAVDQLTQVPNAFNLTLASGLVSYLGEEEALVAIPPKDENTEQAFLTQDQLRLLSLIHIWDFPLLALVLAIIVYVKRR